MKLALKWVSALVVILLLVGCGQKEPPIFKLIKLYQDGKHDEAIALAEKIIAENPNNSQAHRFLVKSAVEKGELEKYEKRYQEWVSENPGIAGYHFGLGYTYTQLQDYDAAIKELNKALELNPNLDYVHYTLGWIYIYADYAGSDPDKGLAEWKKEEEIDPKSFGALQVYSDRADYYLRIGDADSAEKDYEKITLYAFARGDIESAREFINRIRLLRDELARYEAEIKENPDDADLRAKLGVLQYKNGFVKAAVETWTRALEIEPDNAEVQNYLGKAYLEQSHYETAAKYLRKAIESDPTLVSGYYNLALAEDYLGRQKMALEHYKKYLDLNPMAPKNEEVKERIVELEQITAEREG